MAKSQLIRRLAGVGGIVLLLFLALPEPAQACYACEPVHYCVYWGGYWCTFALACLDQGSPCSLCYQGCIEGFDTCGNVGPPCQFASKPPEMSPDRLASAQTLVQSFAR